MSHIATVTFPAHGWGSPLMLMGSSVVESSDEQQNPVALGQELERLYPRVYRTVAGITAGTGLDVDDLTQETFLKAYRSIDSFRGGSSLYTWIYRIARNVCLDALRRRKFRGQFVYDWFQKTDGETDFPDPSGHDVPETRDTRHWIDKALADLPEEFRSVIVFREIQELSYEEIAQILDIPEGTVKSRLFKARRLLRESLESIGITP